MNTSLLWPPTTLSKATLTKIILSFTFNFTAVKWPVCVKSKSDLSIVSHRMGGMRAGEGGGGGGGPPLVGSAAWLGALLLSWVGCHCMTNHLSEHFEYWPMGMRKAGQGGLFVYSEMNRLTMLTFVIVTHIVHSQPPSSPGADGTRRPLYWHRRCQSGPGNGSQVKTGCEEGGYLTMISRYLPKHTPVSSNSNSQFKGKVLLQP